MTTDHDAVSQRELTLILKQLESRDNELSGSLRVLSDNMKLVSEMQGRLAERMIAADNIAEGRNQAVTAAQKELASDIKKLEEMLIGENGGGGLSMRLDRVEQAMLRQQKIANWLFGSGIVSFASSVVILAKILSTLASEHPK